MISVIQRVSSAKVVVNHEIVGEIQHGLVALTSVHTTDSEAELKKTADKLLSLRCFPDGAKAYHLSLPEVAGGLLLISNFTVAADLTGGRRPALHPAASPDKAKVLFDQLLTLCRSKHPKVETGIFGADMRITIINDGPLTLIYDTRA